MMNLHDNTHAFHSSSCKNVDIWISSARTLMTFVFEFYQVPKTVMEDREIEVPRQVYETVTRTVQRPKTVMEDKIVTIQQPKMVQVPRQVCTCT